MIYYYYYYYYYYFPLKFFCILGSNLVLVRRALGEEEGSVSVRGNVLTTFRSFSMLLLNLNAAGALVSPSASLDSRFLERRTTDVLLYFISLTCLTL